LTLSDPGTPSVTREARGRVPGDGVTLAYGYWPGRGNPIVALHGLTASHLNFIGIAERLAGRLPVLGFDLRGRGDSDKPQGPYGMAQHGRDVAAAMRSFGLGPSIVIGHSMGAFVAAALAQQNPELVSALVLIDGGYLRNMPADTLANLPTDPALLQRIQQLVQTYASREAYRDFWRTQPHFPRDQWNAWIEAFLDYEVEGESSVKPKASQTGVLADMGAVLESAAMAERLQSVRVPTLMLRAEQGFTPGQNPLYPDAIAGEIKKLIPQLEDQKFSGTTHYTIMLGHEAAAKIAERIFELSERVSKPPNS
jgi:lipase